MNREIEFRGKRKNNGEWVYGWYAEHPQFGSQIKHNDCWYSVIPATVGQFTGLKDKNGKKSYHKDIAIDRYSQKWVVEWDDYEARFILLLAGVVLGDADEDAEIEKMMWIEDMEVVGNLHDNPDLLKE